MTTIEFNPQNWTDEKATLSVEGDTVHINGETLTLKEGLPIFERDSVKYDFRSILVFWNGTDSHAFCKMTRFGDDDRWTAASNGIERSHSNPAILAAIMACNLI